MLLGVNLIHRMVVQGDHLHSWFLAGICRQRGGSQKWSPRSVAGEPTLTPDERRPESATRNGLPRARRERLSGLIFGVTQHLCAPGLDIQWADREVRCQDSRCIRHLH